MSNEVLPFISNEVVELFEEFDDDYLADVFRIWDCDAQAWHDVTTAVFRFENDDLLVWSEMGELKAKRGAIETQTPFEEPSDVCLIWKTDRAFSGEVGTRGFGVALIESLA